jgi:predicted PurR-regulated permease PerM
VRDGADVDESPTDAADRAERAEERTEQAEERTGQAEERAEEAAADAEESEAGAEQAEQRARTAGHGSREAEHVDRLIEKFDDEGDPLLDTTMHEIVAEVDEQHPFGVPEAPMNFHTPFWIGVRATFGVLLVLLAAESVLKARNVLVLIAVSAFLAIGLNPMVEWLQRHGIGRRASVALISLGFLLFFAGAGLAVAQPIANQGSQLANGLPAEAQHLRDTNKTFRDLDKRFQLVDKIDAAANDSNLKSKVTSGVIGAAGVAVNALFNFFTILILTLYFLANYPGLKRTAWRIAPRSRRPRVGLLGDEILKRVGGYVLGNIATSVVIGVVTFVFLLIIGVPNAAPIALFVAIFDVIPLVGATIAGIVIVVIALFHSLTAAIATLIFYVLYQQFENYVLVPRVMKKTVDVSPLTTIIAALLGGALLGIVGALVAIPIAAAVQLMAQEVFVPRQDSN